MLGQNLPELRRKHEETGEQARATGMKKNLTEGCCFLRLPAGDLNAG